MRKLLIMIILLFALTSCTNNKAEEETTLINQGLYSSDENDTENHKILNLKDGNITIIDHPAISVVHDYKYSQQENNLIVKEADKTVFTFQVVDSDTLKVKGENAHKWQDGLELKLKKEADLNDFEKKIYNNHFTK